MEVEVPWVLSLWKSVSTNGLECATFSSLSVEDFAPHSLREVNWISGNSTSSEIGHKTKLHMVSEHDVSNLMRVGLCSVIWIVEEEWFEEGSTISLDVAHFTVVVSDQGHLPVHGPSDDVDVVVLDWVVELNLASEFIWLLSNGVSVVVVS